MQFEGGFKGGTSPTLLPNANGGPKQKNGCRIACGSSLALLLADSPCTIELELSQVGPFGGGGGLRGEYVSRRPRGGGGLC